jgi:septum formation protein
VAEPAILHLASASPRRREILASLGVPHTWAGTAVDEAPAAGERASDLALRLARAKAMAARASRAGERIILGADTVVTLDDRLFGKPGSEEEAVAMLSQLSGRTHRVITAVVLRTPDGELTAVSESGVTFRRIETDEARGYWQSGEPEGKAGAYAIQGIGGTFVKALSGSYSGVVGLPVYETGVLLRQAGVDLLRAAVAGKGAR